MEVLATTTIDSEMCHQGKLELYGLPNVVLCAGLQIQFLQTKDHQFSKTLGH